MAGSVIGGMGAIGGGLVPNAMGTAKQNAGTCMRGFLFFEAFSLCMLMMLRVMQIRWARTWAEKKGRARSA